VEPDRQPQSEMSLTEAISAWWRAVTDAADGNKTQVGRWVRERATHNYGWICPPRRDPDKDPPPNGTNVGNWIKRGTFDRRPAIRAASVDVMRKLPRPPEGLPHRYTNPQTVLNDFIVASQSGGTTPNTRADSKRATSLESLLGDPAAVWTTVLQATEGEQMRSGFRQGSWLTDNQTPPYVPRHTDEELTQKLQRGFVVVAGPPKAGKTRSVLEALRARMPEKKLWRIRRTPGALDIVWRSVLSDGGRPEDHNPESVVILLDDLQNHDLTSTDGITEGKLKRLVKAGVTIAATVHNDFLATLRNYQFDRARSGRDLELSAGVSPQLVDLLHDENVLVRLDPDLTTEELNHVDPEIISYAAAQDVRPDRFARLPELLAAVDTLFARAEEGREDPTHPERAALVAAAIDASYIYPGGATEEELTQLMQWAFQRIWITKPWRAGHFEAALEWATESIGGPGSTHAVIYPVDDDRLQLFEALLPRLQPTTWLPDHLEKHATDLQPAASTEIGEYCYSVSERTSAERWCREAADAGDPYAMGYLGFLLKEKGQVDEAERWCREAADAGDPYAMGYLGFLLKEKGQVDEAERWYREAADAGHLDAMNNLGFLLKEKGQVDEAERWYREAADAGLLYAMSNLGVLLAVKGQVDEAERWFREAVEAGDPNAMKSLGGFLLREKGQVDEAERWYREAADAGDLDAMGYLGGLLKEKGQVDEAERWYRKAADAGHLDAMGYLGGLLKEKGQVDEAERWCREAADAGDLSAMFNLVVLLAGRGQVDEAERWCREAADAGDLSAMFNLVVLLAGRGQVDEAERWCRKAADAGDLSAMFNLVVLLAEKGQVDEAERYYHEAAGLLARLETLSSWPESAADHF